MSCEYNHIEGVKDGEDVQDLITQNMCVLNIHTGILYLVKIVLSYFQNGFYRK